MPGGLLDCFSAAVPGGLLDCSSAAVPGGLLDCFSAVPGGFCLFILRYFIALRPKAALLF